MNSNLKNIEAKLALRVLARIQQHRSTTPIKGAALAVEFGVSWRKIADVVEELRDNGHKIGSTNTAPHGYFLAVTPEELHPVITRMRDQAKKILARTNRMADWQGLEPTMWEQMEPTNI